MLLIFSFLILIISQITFHYALKIIIEESNLIPNQKVGLLNKKGDKFNTRTIFFSGALIFFINIVFLTFLITYINLNTEFIAIHLLFIIFVIIFHILSIFLITFDLLILEVPENIIKIQILITIVFSVIYSALSLFTQDLINLNLQLGKFDNLIGLMIGFLYSLILVKASHEKFLGEGDIYFFSSIGLILGYKLMVIFLLLFPIVGMVYGLSNAVLFKRVRSLLIPLFPILYISFLLVLIFQNINIGFPFL